MLNSVFAREFPFLLIKVSYLFLKVLLFFIDLQNSLFNGGIRTPITSNLSRFKRLRFTTRGFVFQLLCFTSHYVVNSLITGFVIIFVFLILLFLVFNFLILTDILIFIIRFDLLKILKCFFLIRAVLIILRDFILFALVLIVFFFRFRQLFIYNIITQVLFIIFLYLFIIFIRMFLNLIIFFVQLLIAYFKFHCKFPNY